MIWFEEIFPASFSYLPTTLSFFSNPSLLSVVTEHPSASVCTAFLTILFDIFLSISITSSFFLFHFFYSQKCLPPIPTPSMRLHDLCSRLTMKSRRRRAAFDGVMWCCPCCSTSTVLQPKLTLKTFVGHVTTLMAAAIAQCITFPGFRRGTQLHCDWLSLNYGEKKCKTYFRSFITNYAVHESLSEICTGGVPALGSHAMVPVLCQAPTLTNPPVPDLGKMDDTIVWPNIEAEAPVPLRTFDQQALKRLDIWVLVDQITDVLHPFCNVDAGSA